LLRLEGLIDGLRHFDDRNVDWLCHFALAAPRAAVSNHILSCLSPDDLHLLQPHLEPVELPVRKLLAGRNKRIEHVYFPDSGIVSVVANGGRALELGMVGREGMTGVSVLLDSTAKAPLDTYVRVAGHGQRLSVAHLLKAIDASSSLQMVLLEYTHRFMVQVTETALANGRHNIEERLARWLLMADDRLDGHEVSLTHEFLAVMVGTTRPCVTVGLHEIERRRWITQRRGVVTIVDREGLLEASNGAYLAAKTIAS
jgi:CRP-like cAMP-binding protein